VTPHRAAVCGGWRRAANACDAPAGWGTSHPGYGRCRLHFGNTPRGCVQAACAEAMAISEMAARLMEFPGRGDLVSDVRILQDDWARARYALVNQLAKLRKKASRRGVYVTWPSEITPETLRPHLSPPAPLRLEASTVEEEAAAVERKSPSSVLVETAMTRLFGPDAHPDKEAP
jgi:hypothetical protein